MHNIKYINTYLVILALFLSFVFASSFSLAFYFYGYTKYQNGTLLPNTNVTIKVYYLSNFSEAANFTNQSNASGFFNLSIPNTYNNSNYLFGILVRHFTGQNESGIPLADYVGAAIPYLSIAEFGMLGNIKFYLKPAITVKVTAVSDPLPDAIIDLNNYSVTNYTNGLEWLNTSKNWAYLNGSNCLIILNTNFTVNTSFCNLNITNVKDFEFVGTSNKLFFINLTQIMVYDYNISSINISYNTTYNLSSRNYTNVGGIEYSYANNLFNIFVVNSSNTIKIERFNNTNGLSYFDSIDLNHLGIDPGKVEYYSERMYLSGNSSGTFKLVECGLNVDNCMEQKWNFSTAVSGIEHNGSSWYYGSPNTGNITEFNLTYSSLRNIHYIIKDTKLSYPVAEYTGDEQTMPKLAYGTAYLDRERNYSVMVFPNDAFPITKDIVPANDCSQTTYFCDIQINVSTLLRRVSGYVKVNGSNWSNFSELIIIPYLIEPGNMIDLKRPIFYNISAWKGGTDVYNASKGFYNITLIGSGGNAEILLFAVAKNNTDYFGGFRNITLDYNKTEVDNINITLYPLIGIERNITMDSISGKHNVTVKQVPFVLKNQTGNNNLSVSAYIEAELIYDNFGGPDYGGFSFTWRTDISESNNGTFYLPLLNTSVKKLNIYMQEMPPRAMYVSRNDILNYPVEVNVSSFSIVKPGEMPNETFMQDIRIDLIKSNSECDVPKYNHGLCSFLPKQMNATEFNPITVVMGGGKLSFVIAKLSSGIVIHYVNVDLLASGPPDAMLDETANSTKTGNRMEEVWRFGSSGPEIYDYIIIGVPYNSSAINESAEIRINITKFYTENWEVFWEQGVNQLSELQNTPYEDYLQTPWNAYINGTGALCSKADVNLSQGLCYKDTNEDKVWFKIPHFSGVNPEISGTAIISSSQQQEETTGETRSSGGWTTGTTEGNATSEEQNKTSIPTKKTEEATNKTTKESREKEKLSLARSNITKAIIIVTSILVLVVIITVAYLIDRKKKLKI